jgi:outer membrane lipoprotein-sorting protein
MPNIKTADFPESPGMSRSYGFDRDNSFLRRAGLLIMTLAMLLLPSFSAVAALTAEQVAQKAAAVISDAKGISATFTIAGNGKTSKGSLKSAGQKFFVTLPYVSTWYNGKALYTYNPRIGETTVTTPTAQELLESNPLLYVKGGGSAYAYKFSPVKRNGKYMIDLTPRNSRGGVKKLTFTINSTTFKTERIIVTTAVGSATIDVTSFVTGNPAPASEFEYPKKKYPKAEIIDLR